jgi:hypothetical protein
MLQPALESGPLRSDILLGRIEVLWLVAGMIPELMVELLAGCPWVLAYHAVSNFDG